MSNDLVRRVTAGLLCGALFASLPPLTASFFLPTAMANDDDGGDDDGGGDDGGGGGGGASAGGNDGGGGGGQADDDDDDDRSTLFKKKPKNAASKKNAPNAKPEKKPVRRAAASKAPKKRTVAAQQIAQPVRAPNQIVARDLTSSGLQALTRRGYRELKRNKSADGKEVVLLRIPKGRSLNRARDEVRALGRTKADFNHYFRNVFRPQSGEACKGITCKHFNVVGWKPEISSCKGLPSIGIIDTLVDSKHPALIGTKLEVVNLAEGKPSLSMHGTAVASLIAGAQTGPAPGLLVDVGLTAINVFSVGPNGDDRTDAYTLAAAIDEMRKRKIKLVNLSLAGPENAVLAETIAKAHAEDMILIAAAGNNGPASKPAYPAAYDSVLAVTAVNNELAIYRRAGRGKHIDLAAPGVGIVTAGKKGATEAFTGSSFAVPFVTAAAALQWTQTQGNSESVSKLLIDTARDLGAKGPDSVFGAGLVQMPESCAASVN